MTFIDGCLQRPENIQAHLCRWFFDQNQFYELDVGLVGKVSLAHVHIASVAKFITSATIPMVQLVQSLMFSSLGSVPQSKQSEDFLNVLLFGTYKQTLCLLYHRLRVSNQTLGDWVDVTTIYLQQQWGVLDVLSSATCAY